MHAITFFVLAVAGFAAAQSSIAVPAPATSPSAPVSGCGSSVDLIIQNCLGTENAQLAACAATDWDCMCTQITNVVTCYNNCPTAPDAFAATQRQTSYCNAAKQYGASASSASAATTSPAVTNGPVVAAATTASTSVVSTSSPTTISATQSPTHNAMSRVVVPAQFLAAVVGIVAFL